jgi:signal transduction histidine kinase/CheY-like chemotaxis protein
MQTHPDDMDANLNLWRRALAGESSGYGLEKRYLRPDGSDVWAHVAVSIVRDQNAEPMYTLGIVEEITERKRMQEGLLRAQKLESLGVLAGGIAHDFNNLLTGILGNSMLAWERTPNGDVRSMLEDVVRAAEHASILTQQMLAYAGKGRFVVKPVDLSRLVREVETLLKAAIPKHVPLRLELAADLPPVDADPSQIQQLIMNLGINAAESIENQTNGRVRIATARQRLDAEYIQRHLTGADIRPGLYAALKVEDNGCGMDEETKSKIFDPFFTTKFMGRGLGLAAVYGIVRSHGGTIQVVSNTGKGTAVAVFLPVTGEEADSSARGAAGQEVRATQTILIVDEERVVRQAASKTLEQYGYQTMLAANGEDAVEIFRRNADRISLVLLDLTMRVFGGDKVFGLLKSIRADVPVIVSSGYHERDLAKLFPGPKVTFLQKPYTAPQLADKVKTSLRG